MIQDTTNKSPVAELFPEGAPDVAVSRLAVVRSQIRRKPEPKPEMNDADAAPASPIIQWHVYGFPAKPENESDPEYTVIGDLVLRDGPWFLGVTVSAGLNFRFPIDPPIVSEESINNTSASLAPWAAMLLYDFAAAIARGLAGTTSDYQIQIPPRPPNTHFPRLIHKPRTSGESE